MNKEPRYKEVVVDFVDRVHGTGSPEIRPWRPLSAIPVEIVDVVPGTDGSHCFVFSNSLDVMHKGSRKGYGRKRIPPAGFH